MRFVDPDTLDRIARIDVAHCISLYLAPDRPAAEQGRNRLRLCALADEATAQLIDRGVSPTDAGRALGPLLAMADDDGFWAERGDGLAIFATVGDDEPVVRHLDHPVPDSVIVADHPDIVPVVNPCAANGRFLVLALSPKRVRVLRGDQGGLEQLAIDDLPEDLASYEGMIHELQSLQHHAHAAPFPGEPHASGAASYHGHGGAGGRSIHKVRLEEFARLVDDALHQVSEGDSLPLVVVASEALWPHFRIASRYPQLVEEPVLITPDGLDEDQLLERVWPVVEPDVTPGGSPERQRERVEQQIGAGGSDTLEEVLTAACDGRVDTLLVSRDDRLWGRYDLRERRVHTPDDPHRRQELIGLAACLTRRTGGRVRALPRERIPQRTPQASPVAAVFRY